MPATKTCANTGVNCGPRFKKIQNYAGTACTACADDGTECCTEIKFNWDNKLLEFGLHITAKEGVEITGQPSLL